MYSNTRRLYVSILVSMLALVFTVKTPAQVQNSVGASQPRPAISVLDSTKEQDGLVGSVRRVKTESAKVEVQDGRPVEGVRQLLELTTYGINGNRIENTSYPGRDSLIGKEEYSYDNRGNIIEMTLRNDQGTILSKEAYSYEFDTFGNWTKMVTSLVVFENGQLKSEPVEVTYRTVTYYFNESIAKIANVSFVKKLPKPTEPRQFQPLTLELGKDNNFSFSVSREAFVSSLEAAGTPPPFPSNPPQVGRTGAGDQIGSGEINTLNQTSGVEIMHAPLPSGPMADKGPGPVQNAREAIESERRESVSIPLAASNSSAVKAVPPEASPDNFKPSADGAKKAALEYYRSASALIADGDVKAAIGLYLKSIEFDRESAEVFVSLGAAYVKLDKNSDAAKAFKQAVKLNPSLSEAQYGLGLANFQLRRYREAVVGFKKATSLDPKMAKAHFGLAMAYQELMENNLVIEEYRILEQLDKDLAKRLAKALRDNSSGCWIKKFCR